MNTDHDKGRLKRFCASLALLILVVTVTSGAANQSGLSPFPTMLVLVAYMVVSAVLIAMITGRLFAQHEMRKLRFDLANMVLITTLIALPFAAANTLWGLHFSIPIPELRDHRTGTIVYSAAGLAFLQVPVMFMLEALLFWCRPNK